MNSRRPPTVKHYALGRIDLLSEYAGMAHRNKRDANELLSTLNDLLTH